MLLREEESIVALCTPQGVGTLALFRFVGQDIFERVALFCLLSSKKKLEGVATHTIHHCLIKNPSTGRVVDDAMVIAMRGPKTFTGQDTLEITVHNNPYIINQVYVLAEEYGIRKADPGEFSKRALLNGKIDILQAEAIHELILASNETMVEAALLQLHGSLSAYVQSLEEKLLSLLVLVEASFEFLDEEQRDLDFQAQISFLLQEIIASIQELLKRHSQQQRFRDGVRIVLLGAVNAGKSTLFNALVGKKRSIVSDIAGTTRDTIESSAYLHGFFRTYVDTAGLRMTDDRIEQEGIERSWQEAGLSDIILLIIDDSRYLSVEELSIYENIIQKYAEKIIVVYTKSDIALQKREKYIWQDALCGYTVTTTNAESMEMLESGLEKKVRDLVATSKTAYALNERHSTHLYQVEQLCQKALAYATPLLQEEMVAWHIKDALERISQLSGKSITEQCHDAIFRTFCVGK